jgi:phosphomannomutase
MRLFPASGEINRTIADPAAILGKVQQYYQKDALHIDFTDGLSIEFTDWRFNLRTSNTEPLVRLNVESRTNETLMQRKTAELLSLLSE